MIQNLAGTLPRRLAIGAALVCLLATGGATAGESERKVPWHQVRYPSLGPTQVLGGYAHGCLAGGVSLPLDGPGYQVMRPGRHRYYGHPALLDYLKGLGRRAQSAGLALVNIGDLSQPRGGPTPSGHASHQNGIDVDIWLRQDLSLLPRDRRDGLSEVSLVSRSTVRVIKPGWTTSHTELLRLATKDPRVTRIFVNPAIKLELCQSVRGDRSWLHFIRPWYGHDDHIHARLACPADSPSCEPQRPLPPGDGCGEEVASWLPSARPLDPKRPVSHRRPPNPTLPAACYQVNVASSPVGAELHLPQHGFAHE
ncbi:MAG: penicillin-insensitive murein endopeptidase [Rhodospirillaceae bacterium]